MNMINNNNQTHQKSLSDEIKLRIETESTERVNETEKNTVSTQKENRNTNNKP